MSCEALYAEGRLMDKLDDIEALLKNQGEVEDLKRRIENQKQTITELTAELASRVGMTGIWADSPYEVLQYSRRLSREVTDAKERK